MPELSWSQLLILCLTVVAVVLLLRNRSYVEIDARVFSIKFRDRDDKGTKSQDGNEPPALDPN
ncbi:unnamed protein product [Gemmata massiliana]|uniref:Uncharacterized protein n=1 Tax=Gemmata massiliana TaxID=1210884 RepID=A0A6P2DAB8_9BACT|nr:unnamed protein product [Gemmata massiliana]